MKKFNYLYFAFITGMWFVIGELLSVLMHYHPAWLLLPVAYSGWYILSAPLFYTVRKRRGVKEGFKTDYHMEAEWTTFWIDLSNKELAYLCMFNPFRVHYLPLNAVNNAKQDIYYSSDKKYIDHINCIFFINNRRNKIRVVTRGKYYRINAEQEGKGIISRTQKFINLLNGDLL